MPPLTGEQRQVLALLKELLAQRCPETPHIHLQRYAFALRSLVYASPRTPTGYDTTGACMVLVEAMHLIYHKKEADAAPWVQQVEECTYDAYTRLRRIGPAADEGRSC